MTWIPTRWLCVCHIETRSLNLSTGQRGESSQTTLSPGSCSERQLLPAEVIPKKTRDGARVRLSDEAVGGHEVRHHALLPALDLPLRERSKQKYRAYCPCCCCCCSWEPNKGRAGSPVWNAPKNLRFTSCPATFVPPLLVWRATLTAFWCTVICIFLSNQRGLLVAHIFKGGREAVHLVRRFTLHTCTPSVCTATDRIIEFAWSCWWISMPLDSKLCKLCTWQRLMTRNNSASLEGRAAVLRMLDWCTHLAFLVERTLKFPQRCLRKPAHAHKQWGGDTYRSRYMKSVSYRWPNGSSTSNNKPRFNTGKIVKERTVTENSTQIILIDPNRRQSSLRYFAALRQHTVGEREANTGTRNKVGKVGTWGSGQ